MLGKVSHGFRRHSVVGSQPKKFDVALKNCSFICRAQFGGRFDKRIKYGLQIEGGAADDFERLGCRSLLLQCLVSLASKPRYLRFLAGG
jgi:hypothetical protein